MSLVEQGQNGNCPLEAPLKETTKLPHLEFADESLLGRPLFLVGFPSEQLVGVHPVIKRPTLCLQLRVVQLQ